MEICFNLYKVMHAVVNRREGRQERGGMNVANMVVWDGGKCSSG